jgi:[ribosomal protein S5]-alanine N-acetyltransferase
MHGRHHADGRYRPAVGLLPPGAPLTDGTVVLRPIDDRDLPVLERAARDCEIARRFGLAKLPPREYLDAYSMALRAGSGAAFAIDDPGGACFGQVVIEVRDSGRADVGYWLLPEGRGRGRATSALELLSRWALAQPGIARLQLWTVPENVASQRVAERSGFQREGVLRSYAEVDGRRVDAVFYSLLPGDLG